MEMNETTEIPMVNFSGGSTNATAGPEKQVLLHNMSTELQEYEIVTPGGVPLRVYHQAAPSTSAILTYHDIGTNHTSFLGFFAYPEMRVLLRNFNIYHICAPGHYDGADAIVSPPGSESGGFLSSLWNWGNRVNAYADADAHVGTFQTIVVKPSWVESIANGGRPYVFQQDSAPSHRALKTRDWMDGREFSSSCHTKLMTAS
ncbi:hypothetical protein ACTXT7_013805 [Hymenolepis weldensis]